MIYDVSWGVFDPKWAEAPAKPKPPRCYDVGWTDGKLTVKMWREPGPDEFRPTYGYHYIRAPELLGAIHDAELCKRMFVCMEMPATDTAKRYVASAGTSGFSGRSGASVSGRFYEKFVKRKARKGRHFV